MLRDNLMLRKCDIAMSIQIYFEGHLSLGCDGLKRLTKNQHFILYAVEMLYITSLRTQRFYRLQVINRT